jgi:membrane associated rhomboid family serine protease
VFWLTQGERGVWGVYPRSLEGLIGLVGMPLVHGDWQHLFSNSVPLWVLMAGILYLYREIAWPVILYSFFVPPLWVWSMGRVSYHIGASAMVFSFAFFLFFSGILRKEVRTLALALIVAFLYGGMIWGVFPGQQGISWEGHLFGAITGTILAVYYRKKGPQKPDRWADETDRPEDRFGAWNYKELFPPPEGFNYPEK